MSKVSNIPEELIDRFLSHAVFDGWSWRALEAAGKDVGLDKAGVQALAPKGPRDVVLAFNDLSTGS